MSAQLRPARKDDASAMAELANIAGGGIPDVLWARRCDYGTQPRDYGVALAERDEGQFSWRRAIMAEWDGEVVGMMVTHALGHDPRPMESDIHPILRPMIRLENEALDTQAVNMLAIYPQARRRGLGTALLQKAEKTPGAAGMSILMTDGNTAGRAFATHHGYQEAGRLPLVRSDWNTQDENWILMRKT